MTPAPTPPSARPKRNRAAAPSALAAERERRLKPLGRSARAIYELLRLEDEPQRAYQLLWRLTLKRGRPVAPSTVYLGLRKLIESGLAHKVNGLGAYVLCADPSDPHNVGFLICETCRSAVEIHADKTAKLLRQSFNAKGAAARDMHIDIWGSCARCLGQQNLKIEKKK
jgi:Fur family zinc uptake transcriptional regulator